MNDVTFDAPINTNIFEKIDARLLEIISRNRDIFVYKGFTYENYENDFQAHVSKLCTSISHDLIYCRPYGEPEINILIGNDPVEQSITDFLICCFGRALNALRSNQKELYLRISEGLSYRIEAIERILADLSNTLEIEIVYSITK